MKLRGDYVLKAVQSRTGANAKAVATQYGGEYATTDFDALLADQDLDLLLISTRHDLHASMVLQTLRSGKNCFVEKPLALNEAELAEIEAFYRAHPAGPLLMTGFNRRFSPALSSAAAALAGRATPVLINYRMNAGFIPPDHWVHGPEGGGRNIGEACHIYDLFAYLTRGAVVTSVHAASISPAGKQWRRNDNFVATIAYADGSVAALTYTALGDKSYPKERMEIFADGKVVSLDDYKALTVTGNAAAGWEGRAPEKGQFAELQALAKALKEGGPWPIPLDEQLQTMRIAFAVEDAVWAGTDGAARRGAPGGAAMVVAEATA
jgi:predicted dehydrogenase